MSAVWLRVPLWVWLTLAVVVTSVSALVPLHEPRLPGTLRLGVLGGEDPAALERSFGPFADYLGLGLRRSAILRVVTPAQARRGEGADVLLIPSALVGARGADVLAWAKPLGLSATGSGIVLVRPSAPDRVVARLAVGDSLLAGGITSLGATLEGLGVRATEIVVGRSVYRHDEALALLEHGAVDAAVVRRGSLESARARGQFPPSAWSVREIGPPRPLMALVACPSLSGPARDEVREQALNLDHFRYDPQNAPVGVVLQGLAQLGIGGFVPTEPFPSLRP